MNRTCRFQRFTSILLCIIMMMTIMLTAMPNTTLATSTAFTIPLINNVPDGTAGNGWTYSPGDHMLNIDNGYTLNGFSQNGIIGASYIYLVLYRGTIAGGIFMRSVRGEGSITGGTFHDSVINYGTITGGTFQSSVMNYGTITGGYFFKAPQGSSGSFGGGAKLVNTLSIESKGGTAMLGVSGNTDASNFLSNNGRGIEGETYNVQTNNGNLIGLYLLGKDDAVPQAPYTIDSTKFRKLLGGLAYEFEMPDEDTTVFAVYKGYGGELDIGGAIEEAFNFEKDSSGQQYIFNLQSPPAGLTNYLWSVEGTLPAGLTLMNSTTNSAYIGGTPTEVTNNPVALTVSVRATAANGDVYYGEANILIRVYIPENPFAEAEALLKAADCTVSMEAANTEGTVLAWLNDTWLPGIDGLSAALGGEFDINELLVVLDEGFTAATAGNSDNPNGTDGSVTLTVEIVDRISLCENLTCTVKAAAYNHTHSFSDTYSHDNTYHWYECTDPECDEVSGKALHNGTDDGNCTTKVVCECGYCTLYAAVNHRFTGEYEYNENAHWHTCQNLGCNVTDTQESHRGGTANYTDRAVCSVCGQSYGATAADTTPPTGSIKVGTNTWYSRLNIITFKLFFKQTQKVTITAADTESGVMKTEYCLSDTKLDDFTSVQWIRYTGSFNINPDNEYVIYVKITDNAGNSAIINSNGIVLDMTAPLISGIQNGKTYCGAVEVTVSVKYLNSIKLNENEIALTDGKFIVNSSAGKQIITATDMAGNSTTYIITVNSGHTLSSSLKPIDYQSHGNFCTVCNTVIEQSIGSHSFEYSDGKRECTLCEYELVSDASKPGTVYNDSAQPNATVWLTGLGLDSGDLLVTERNPQGSAFEALLKLADFGDVFDSYNIYLRSGQKSSASPMNLTFDLNGQYGGQDFTLVHQKATGTYEYFYDVADGNGDLTFGPLYELSPFMLVKGTLTPPQGSDLDSPQTGDNRNVFLWTALLILSGIAATTLCFTKKRRKSISE